MSIPSNSVKCYFSRLTSFLVLLASKSIITAWRLLLILQIWKFNYSFLIHFVLYLEVYSDKRCQFLSRYLSQLLKHIMKQRTVYREDKCHVFQSVSWAYQHISWTLQTYNCWLPNICFTPSPRIYCFTLPLLLFQVLGYFLPFVCQLFFLFMHTGVIPLAFFCLFHIRLKFSFFCQVSSHHTKCVTFCLAISMTFLLIQSWFGIFKYCHFAGCEW